MGAMNREKTWGGEEAAPALSELSLSGEHGAEPADPGLLSGVLSRCQGRGSLAGWDRFPG